MRGTRFGAGAVLAACTVARLTSAAAADDGKDLFWKWDGPVVVRQELAIGAYDKYKGDRTTASWFPTQDYALKWQEFCHTSEVTDWSRMRAPVRIGRE